MRAIVSLIAGLALLAGCGEFPELTRRDSPFAQSAAYPTLIPLEGTALETDEDELAEDFDEGARLNSRANALRNRAKRLQGEVIDEPTRKRLEEGVIEG